MNLRNSLWLVIAVLLLSCQNIYSQIQFKGDYQILGNKIELLVDSNSKLSIDQVRHSTSFIKSHEQFPNLGITPYSYWLKFKIENNHKPDNLFIQISQPTLDEVEFYQLDKDSIIQHNNGGSSVNFGNRMVQHQSFVFPVQETKDQDYTFYIRLKSEKQLTLPIYVGTIEQVNQQNQIKDMVFGLYVGIIMSMLLYNLFIYSTVQDKNYIYYVVYLALVLLTQASLEGYLFRFILPEHPKIADASIYISSALLGLAAIEFSKNFLATKTFVPKLHKLSFIFWLGYLITIVLFFTGHYNMSYQLILAFAMFSAVYVLAMAITIVIKGSRSAIFFLIAWSVFILCVIVYVLKDADILPYNALTNSALLIGSSIEALMLSFALADKINIFKKEKERSQEETLKALHENERIVREQNVILEEKVKERTEALEETNHNLNDALDNLKEAQSQLVDAEKMAGLGQLTAGIAHEINNPINFVTSNIKPLELDINDLNNLILMYEKLDITTDLEPQISKIDAYKRQIDLPFVRDEIKSLLSGISEGAKRTAEIIRSLKNFSRLDENDTKAVDLNEGLASTLVLVRNTFPDNMNLIKEFGNIPNVECMPGKINQVFMNLITNAIHAIKTKEPKNEIGTLAIKTWFEDKHVKISIKDSGTGMSDEVKQKIFEPFFTTKDIGEGTGLGLSIVFRIIENHHGHIDVISKINVGTEFIITLPVN